VATSEARVRLHRRNAEAAAAVQAGAGGLTL